MSHPVARLVADWLADATNGVNAMLDEVPRFSGDSQPGDVTVYDEWRHGFVARRRMPDAADATASISFPAVLVVTGQADYPGDRPKEIPSGTMEDGTLQVIAALAIQAEDSEDAVTATGYYLRAIRGSLLKLIAGTDTQRTVTDQGIRIQYGRGTRLIGPTELGKDFICNGAVVAQFAVWETTPVTS